MTKEELIAKIDEKVYENENHEVTAESLNEVLKDIVGEQFSGEIHPDGAADGVKVRADEEDGFIVLEPIVGEDYGIKIRAFGNEINMIDGNLYINPFRGGVIIGSDDQDAGDSYLIGNWYNNGVPIDGILRLSGAIPVGPNIQEYELQRIGLIDSLILDGHINRVTWTDSSEILNVVYTHKDSEFSKFVLSYSYYDDTFELNTLTQYTFEKNANGTWNVELVEI